MKGAIIVWFFFGPVLVLVGYTDRRIEFMSFDTIYECQLSS